MVDGEKFKGISVAQQEQQDVVGGATIPAGSEQGGSGSSSSSSTSVQPAPAPASASVPSLAQPQAHGQAQAQGIRFGDVDPASISATGEGVQLKKPSAGRRESQVRPQRPGVSQQQQQQQASTAEPMAPVATMEQGHSLESGKAEEPLEAGAPTDGESRADGDMSRDAAGKKQRLRFGEVEIQQAEVNLVLADRPRSDVPLALDARLASSVPASIRTTSAPVNGITSAIDPRVQRSRASKSGADRVQDFVPSARRALLAFGMQPLPLTARRRRVANARKSGGGGPVFGEVSDEVQGSASGVGQEKPLVKQAEAAVSTVIQKVAADGSVDSENKHQQGAAEHATTADASAGAAPAASFEKQAEQKEVVQPAQTTDEAAASVETTNPAPTAEIAPAPAAPKPKPSTWAALLKPSTAAAASPASTAAPASSATTGAGVSAGASKVGSPAASSVGLPSEDAAPANAATSAASAPSAPTPASATATAPAPAPARKPFNYASAAASAQPPQLTPAEELVKLLSEGVKYVPPVAGPSGTYGPTSVKGKEKAVPQQRFGVLGSAANGLMQGQSQAQGDGERREIIPRGLINTGNMCFANTVSFDDERQTSGAHDDEDAQDENVQLTCDRSYKY